jgi:GxxExxY protein
MRNNSVKNPEYDLAGTVIGFAMKVHRTLGAGFLESVYHNAMLVELKKAGLAFETEKSLDVIYDGIVVGKFSADLLVNNELIVELKAVQALNSAHEVQTVNYLTATGIDLGLLLNFGAESLEFKKKYRLPKAKIS